MNQALPLESELSMAATTISCPYCNACVPMAEGGSAVGRVSCPRCGETFAYRSAEANADAGGQAASMTTSPAPGREAPAMWFAAGASQAKANRRFALRLVAIMVVVAVVALGFALLTRPFRRSHDRPQPTAYTEHPQPVRTAGSALAYLPPDVNVVAVIRVAQALDQPAGKELFHWLHLDGPAGRAGLVQQATALRPEEIESVVVGLKSNARQTAAVVIVQTRRPYDLTRLLSALHAAGPDQRGDKSVYRLSADRLTFRVLWSPARNILVLALNPEDLDAVPATPSSGVALAPPLEKMIEERSAGNAEAWIAGFGDHWEKNAAALLLSVLPKQEHGLLSRVRAFEVWLGFDPSRESSNHDLIIHAAVDCGDESTAKALDASLKRWKNQRRRFSTARTKSLVSLRALFTVAELQQLLDRAVPGKH